ncbi:PREDICTED: ankyrin-1-like, partial [Vollenhovia emeryi]|uniref:ankyrin-1-like n=1 Tax=Vollenhovia emeryi TaxID=411798 RepID=UPI0005F4391E
MNSSELQEILSAIAKDDLDASNVIDRIENQLEEQDFDIILPSSGMDVKTILLHIAAEYGHLEIVECLVGKKDVAVDLRDTNDNTPLHRAVLKNDSKIVEYLIKNHADPNVKNNLGFTPLYLAATYGYSYIVEYLVKKGAALGIRDKKDNTPLYAAVLNGHSGIVEYLVKKGADPNMKNYRRATPLHAAAEYGHLKIVECLVKNKAAPDVQDRDGYTPLHLAAARGHLEIVKYFIEKKDVAPDVQYHFCCIALHTAAAGSHLNIVKYLVEKGADPNMRNYRSATPLHAAAEHGHLEIVKYLIEEKNVPPCVQDSYGYTLLHLAATCGHLEIVEYLVGKKNVAVDLRDTSDNTPLHLAATCGHLEIVEYLIKNRADFNVRNRNNKTPLDAAHENGRLDIVKYLNEKKVAADEKNKAPLHMAVKNSKHDIVQATSNAEAKHIANKVVKIGVSVGIITMLIVTIGCVAANVGLVIAVTAALAVGTVAGSITHVVLEPSNKLNKLLELLISAKNKGHMINRIRGELERQDKDLGDVYKEWLGSQANTEYAFSKLYPWEDIGIAEILLHIVAHIGALETVKYLVEKENANVNAKDYLGSTALHFAAESGHLGVVEYFVKNGADVSARDNEGLTPLLVATKNGRHCIIKYFIDQTKVDTNIASYCNCTILHFAAESGICLRLFKYFLCKGAKVDARDRWGFTPLHLAAESNRLGIVKYLIKNFTDEEVYIDAKNDDDNTPLHLAAESGHLEIVEYLVGEGANVNAQNDEGLTPAGIANENGHLDIVKYFSKKRGASDAKNNSDPHIAAERIKLDEVQSNKADIVLSVFDITSILRLNQISLNEKAYGKLNMEELRKYGCELDNIIEKIKEKLKAIDLATYEKWENFNFNVNYLINNCTERYTLLHIAAGNGYIKTVKALLEIGAKVNVVDRDGVTPLHL